MPKIDGLDMTDLQDDPIPTGTYQVQLVKCNPKEYDPAKDEPEDNFGGIKGLSWHMKIIDGDEEGRLIFFYHGLKPGFNGRQKMSDLLAAAHPNGPQVGNPAYKFDSDDFIGATLEVTGKCVQRKDSSGSLMVPAQYDFQITKMEPA